MKALYVRSLRMRLPLLALSFVVAGLLRATCTLTWSRGEQVDGLRAVSSLAFSFLLPLLGLSLGGSLFDGEELPASFLWARPLARREVLRARIAADLTVLALSWVAVAGAVGFGLDGDASGLVAPGGTLVALCLYVLGSLASMAGLSAPRAASAAAGAGAGLTLVALFGRALGAPLASPLLPTTLGQALFAETFVEAMLVVAALVGAGCAIALRVHAGALPRRLGARTIVLPLLAAAGLGALSPVAQVGMIRALAPQTAFGVLVRLHAPPGPASATEVYTYSLGRVSHGLAPTPGQRPLRTLYRISSPTGEIPSVSPGVYTACVMVGHAHGSNEVAVCREVSVAASPPVQDVAIKESGHASQPAQHPAPRAQ